jgi:ACS family glucarate transporter-like MFS transporter
LGFKFGFENLDLTSMVEAAIMTREADNVSSARPNAFEHSILTTGPADSSGATSFRWRIMSIVMLIMAVTALNRLNLSIAGKTIEEEFAFDTINMSRIFSSFLWGYALFQIPWGYICDRLGPVRTLTASMLCFGLGAGMMGVAPHLALSTGFSVLVAFQVIRFFTGVGEAAVWPACVRVIASWTSVGERGFASGLQSAGLGLGGTLTPIFIARATIHYGWRVSFYLCSAFALLTVVVWRANATDWPEQHKKVNAAELAEIHPATRSGSDHRRVTMNANTVPWLKILSSASVWGLILGYGCQGYAFYVYFNWFYFYAVQVRGLKMMQAAAWTSAPFLAMALLSPVGGWFSDRLSRRSGRRQGRIYAVWLGMGVSAVLLLLGSHLSITVIALSLIALAAGFNYFATSNFWASCIDLAPGFSASLSGLMNTVGNVGGAISSTATAYLAVRQGWSRALDVAALVTIGSGLLFSVVNAGQTIEETSQSD